GYRLAGRAVAERRAGVASQAARAAVVGQFRRNWLDSFLWTLRATEQPVASLKRWMVAGLVGCLALGLAYLPPRGATPSEGSVFMAQSRRGTPARQHAQALEIGRATCREKGHVSPAIMSIDQLS